jgi:hypothetical protein
VFLQPGVSIRAFVFVRRHTHPRGTLFIERLDSFMALVGKDWCSHVNS